MKRILFTLSLLITAALELNAQGYHLGQVITNPDGSQGVVFYLNEDGTEGWMVALHDASNYCPWGPSGHIEGLNDVNAINDDFLSTVFLDLDGYEHTLRIREHCEATGYTGPYAAGMVDIENGWYLPSAGQLKWLYINAIFYEPALQSVGEKMGLNTYWSSSVANDQKAWYIQFGAPYPMEAWAWNGNFRNLDRGNFYDLYDRPFSVRAIRNLEPSPMPVIGHLYNPAVICDEGPIELVMPNIINADSYGWEIAADAAFTAPIAYTGQILDITYNGWYLRLWATNEDGTSYSNVAQISVHETNSGYATISSCESYEWNGQIYNESGIYQATLVNHWGCDSIATLDLTINHPDEYFVPYPIYACERYEWGDMTLTESGAYEQTFTNQNGCDSIVTISLFIKHNVEHQVSHMSCGEYNWNGQVISEGGVYQQTFPAANGCDSIVTLHLTMIDAYHVVIDTAVCESFVWNGYEHTQSGQYEQTFVSSNDCDSVVSINLVVWQHPEAIPEIMGLQDIFVTTEFFQTEYNYHIDSVAFATHYEWFCEGPDWIVDASGTHCTLKTETPGITTLKVKAWNICGYSEQEIIIHAGFFGVDENSGIQVAMYPNPAKEKVVIEAEGVKSIKVFDIHGQCLINQDAALSNHAELSVQQLAAGIYLVEIQTVFGTAKTRLVIEAP